MVEIFEESPPVLLFEDALMLEDSKKECLSLPLQPHICSLNTSAEESILIVNVYC